jgi:quinol monooxygenase YgiN
MSISVLVAFAGVLVAAVGTGLLAGQCVRRPRTSFIAWTVGMFALTVALLAESIGFATGFGALTFRIIQLSGQLVAPLMLGWGLVELVARGTAVRFAARLVTAALAVVAGVVLATDPLAAKPFAKSWPSASVHYQLIPHYALILVALVAAVAAVAVLGVCASRGNGGSAAGPRLPGVAALAGATLLLVALRFTLPGPAYPTLSAIAAGLLWFGMSQVGDLATGPARVGADRGFGDRGSADRGRPGRGSREAGRGVREARGSREAGHPELVARPPAADDFDVPDFPPVGQAPGRGGDRGQRDRAGRDRPRYQPAAPGAEPSTGMIDVSAPGLAPGMSEIPLPVPARTAASGPGTDLALPVTPPHGLIAIYTLLEDKVADFDRAADEAAEQVRANEPDTLIYVIHTVPKAPMQRIFYEVYRDRAAYERHEKQPYVERFVTARRPYVLATNVIELRLKYAKVSPLPQAEAQAAQAQAQSMAESLAQAQSPAPSRSGPPAPSPAGTPNLPAVRTGTGSRSGAGRPGPPGRDPAYPPRDPGYPPRDPGYPGRDPAYPPRDPGYPPRDPGYPGRGRNPSRRRDPYQSDEPPAAPRFGRI